MSLFSLSVLSSPLLGPIPFYLFLFYWLYHQPGREHPVLHGFNLALATLLVSSALTHGWLDWRHPAERQISRILDTGHLDAIMHNRPVPCTQLSQWATSRTGRLQSNAVYLLRYCKDPQARRTLEQIQRQGPPLSTLATQSLARL